MQNDKRLESVINQILRIIGGDYHVHEKTSGRGDEIDAAMAGLNTLADELRFKSGRINSLIEVLLKYTVLDFSEKAYVSDAADEIDAIAAGLNALGEETQYSLASQEKYQKILTDKNHQLESANRELESFTYSVSHDLRTPLRAIHGYSQVLLEDCDEKLEDDCKQALRFIMGNAKKMGGLIDDLLTFSRLGRKEISKTKLNTNKLVADVLSLMNETREPRNKVIVHPLPEIYGDYGLMGQVFQNLISNAFKYSAKNESVRIEIGYTPTENGEAFYVKDNGAGFDMNYYDKLFGVFQRLHREDEFEGTGVGLPIVERIISRHGGIIWAEGAVNEGAAFYFTIETIREKK